MRELCLLFDFPFLVVAFVVAMIAFFIPPMFGSFFMTKTGQMWVLVVGFSPLGVFGTIATAF